ncbi:MAG: helix-turn-helix transcriptional regulator [Erysipelotrichaceae bacterium]|nr:helix-turn-helix transcriptional regulator [Erysipelotrichaceae bacterium]
MITFGGIMKLQMEKMGIKQEVLAKDLNIARTTVTSYCNDKRQPDFDTMIKICHKLKINLSQVLDLSKYNNEDMILHNDFEYKVNKVARTVKKENYAKFLKGVEYLADLLKDENKKQ